MSQDATTPEISFIVPAHNEEAELGATLDAIRAAGAAVGEPFEVLVADDASTDRTAEVARSHGATVVAVSLRQIAAVRNAGAKAARGRLLIFVDADTRVTALVVAAALDASRKGAVGGGARVQLDLAAPGWGRVLTRFISWRLARKRLAAGCFLYVRREVFEAVGGFDERYYAAEEIILSRALHARGPFVILPSAVTTSARKFRMYQPWQVVAQALRILGTFGGALHRRKGLGLWYDGARERDASR